MLIELEIRTRDDVFASINLRDRERFDWLDHDINSQGGGQGKAAQEAPADAFRRDRLTGRLVPPPGARGLVSFSGRDACLRRSVQGALQGVGQGFGALY